MRWRTRLVGGLVLAAMAAASAWADGAIPVGSAEAVADLGGTALTVFTYKPEGCTPRAMLLVFHGVGRNADGYRDHARPLAQSLCLLVVAPRFDQARFPRRRYQEGGVIRHGTAQPPQSWTGTLAIELVDWVRQREAAPSLPYDLLGHSAGAQFVDRLAAFVPNQAQRIVIANPSTYVRARLDLAAPFGFAGLYPGDEASAALKRYLAAPITVLLGQADTLSKNLAESPEAQDQGATRYARGQFVFHEAERVAAEHGWPFAWRLAEVPGVGHDAKEMFASPQAAAALQP